MRALRPLLALIALPVAVGCVPKKRYDATLDQLSETQAELAEARVDADQAWASADSYAEVAADLRADKQELLEAVHAQRSRRAAAESRSAHYRELVDRFSDLIDSGDLRVKVEDHRMVVEVGADILFPSGSADLSDEGLSKALQMGEVLASLTDREIQVEGHTDTQPIATARFPSNWHLGAERAIAVADMLKQAGLSPDRVSVASYASTEPVASNETAEGRALNRRIEIVLQPDLSLLPQIETGGEVTAQVE